MRTEQLVKKKVLIISNFFAPDNVIGAIRMTKVGKYLSNSCSCDVDVITAHNDLGFDQLLQSDLKHFNKVNVIERPKSLLVWIQEKKKKRRKEQGTKVSDVQSSQGGSGLKIKETIKYLLMVIDEYRYYKEACKCELLSDTKYDCVISTYNTLSGHWIAKRIMAKGLANYWVADFRDPVFNEYTPKGFRRFSKNYTRNVLLTCNKAVAVSEGLKRSLNSIENVGDKIEVITNGYDREDLLQCVKCSEQHPDKLILTYAGALYEGKRDLSVAFDVLSELVTSGDIESNRIEVLYLGNAFGVLKKQASKYGMSNILRDEGFVPREQSIDLQNNSDALLLCSWNTTMSQGVLTGKFFEYMMMRKPIICVINGDVAHSKLKAIIEETRTGFCYEQATHIQDRELLKQYITGLYRQKINDGQGVTFDPNESILAQYDYCRIAQKYYSLIES